MKKQVMVLTIALMLVFGLSACYLPVPNEEEVEITDYDARIFMVMGDKITSSVWEVDGKPVENQNKAWYYFYPSKMGAHTVEIHFKDNGKDCTQKWSVDVK